MGQGVSVMFATQGRTKSWRNLFFFPAGTVFYRRAFFLVFMFQKLFNSELFSVGKQGGFPNARLVFDHIGIKWYIGGIVIKFFFFS